MAIAELQNKYIPQDNYFYRRYYHFFIIALMALILLMLSAIGVVLVQILHRPLPVFTAIQPDNKKMTLTAFSEPNLLPDTIIRFASKAATIAYTFDFVNYQKQIEEAHSYFTDAGWADFLSSINVLIDTVIKNQLFVTGVVYGPPVISNQGPLPGVDYAWRVQIPFLVTYQSANTQTKRKFYVVITIVRVPTSTNPQGIGISQFVMV
ncbi:MAG: IcmL protein [uncultured bacterium]|nr:MAG: IcmL protein [uncultured bacterium]